MRGVPSHGATGQSVQPVGSARERLAGQTPRNDRLSALPKWLDANRAAAGIRGNVRGRKGSSQAYGCVHCGSRATFNWAAFGGTDFPARAGYAASRSRAVPSQNVERLKLCSRLLEQCSYQI